MVIAAVYVISDKIIAKCSTATVRYIVYVLFFQICACVQVPLDTIFQKFSAPHVAKVVFAFF